MSTINVEVVTIEAILPHPDADKLEVVQVLGSQCCSLKGKHHVGETVLWFPPDLLIPEPVAEALQVAKYLKGATYPGDTKQTHCKVAACRLRGIPSHGFVSSLDEAFRAALVLNQPGESDKAARVFAEIMATTLGTSARVDELFGAVKYEPPARGTPGAPRAKGFNADAAPDCPAFHKYTDIENAYKYLQVLEEGTPVRITEKVHGCNIRLGLVRMPNGDFDFQVGSHKVNWKPVDAKGNTPVWWQFLTEEIVNLLTDLCDGQNDVIVFGELFGPGVQDMDYGAGENLGLRVFDISVNKVYLNWAELHMACVAHGVQLVPLLYIGPFSKAVLDEHTYGPTQVADPEAIRCKFKDREGCVVTPLVEQYDYRLGRVILKSISADYKARKGAQDN
jgi:RNA ligase (TIGR02306 family)